jgi:flagellar basal body-associated protein FliL
VKKGILIAIGIAVAIAIAAVMTGLNVNTAKETKITQTPINTTTLPSTPPVTHGRNFSVNLTESVGVSGH